MARRSSCGIMAKVIDCSVEVSEIELQSRHYVNFRTSTLRKNMNFDKNWVDESL